MSHPRLHDAFANIATTGDAALFTFQLADGSTQQLEVLRDSMTLLLSRVLAAAHSMNASSRPITELAPSEAALCDPSDIRAVQVPPQGTWLYVRIGAADMAIPFIDPNAAAELARMLDPVKR